MAWPDSQARRTKLTIPSSVVSGSGILTDFPVLVTRADLSDEMCSSTSPNRAQSDGGDLVAALGDDGTSRLALEVVAFEYDSTDGAGDAVVEIWVTLDVSGTADTEFYIGYNTSGTSSQPAVSEPYGRNAVWSEAELALLMDSTTPVDHSGNHTMSVSGTPDAITDGPFGAAIAFVGAEYWYNSTDSSLYSIPTTFDTTISLISRRATSDANKVALAFDGSDDLLIYPSATSFDGVRAFWRDVGGTGYIYSDGYTTPDATWVWTSLTIRGVEDHELYRDGASVGTSNRDASGAGPFSGFSVGSWFGGQAFGGDIAAAIVWKSARSDDWIATEYANQNDPASFVTVGTPEDVGAEVTVSPNDAAHAHTAENTTVTQVHTLSPADAAHGHIADSPTVHQAHDLSPADSVHAHSADNATITQVHVVVVSGATHGHTADNVTILQAGDVEPSDATHGHSVDSATVTQNHVLAPNDVAHGQTAGTASITQNHVLAPASTAHSQTADNVTIAQVHALSVQDAVHGHTADSATVTLAGTILPADATHGQTADNVDLVQLHDLIIAGAAHAHSAENVTLAQIHFLAAASALHAQSSDNVTVIDGSPPTPGHRTIAVQAQDRRIIVPARARTITVN